MALSRIEIGLEQRGLCDFAMKLRDFKLIRLFVMTQKTGRFNSLLPIPVLLVNLQQQFARLLGHIARQQA